MTESAIERVRTDRGREPPPPARSLLPLSSTASSPQCPGVPPRTHRVRPVLHCPRQSDVQSSHSPPSFLYPPSQAHEKKTSSLPPAPLVPQPARHRHSQPAQLYRVYRSSKCTRSTNSRCAAKEDRNLLLLLSLLYSSPSHHPTQRNAQFEPSLALSRASGRSSTKIAASRPATEASARSGRRPPPQSDEACACDLRSDPTPQQVEERREEAEGERGTSLSVLSDYVVA